MNPPVQLKDTSFNSPADNILYDEVLLTLAEKKKTGNVLRFWESETVFIVLGRTRDAKDDLNERNVEADHVPVIRRSSGGGTVVEGPGCLNYSLVLAKGQFPVLNDIRQSYAWISQFMIDALSQCGIQSVFRPTSDIALLNDNRKISGNAQRRRREYVLHHGTILLRFPLELIERYLSMPDDMPEYRQGRPHRDFVSNVDLDSSFLKKSFSNQFKIIDSVGKPSVEEEKVLEDLRKSRLGEVM